MKFLNKKVPLGFVLASLFVISAAVYSFGYKMAMDKFNDIVSYAQERKQMYSKISEVDYKIRMESVADFSEDKVLDALCKGYISGIEDENFKFFTESEYKIYKNLAKTHEEKITFDMINEDIFYTRVFEFGNGVGQSFVTEVNQAIHQATKKVIIDLRECSGGEASEAFKILEHILPKGEIVSTMNKKDEREVVCKSASAGIDAKIIVIVNKNTSGAAEIIASALKDSKKAQIVGAATAGNAVKEKIAQLSDDCVLIFPEAHYVTQSGNVFYKKGVNADISAEISEENLILFKNSELSYEEDSQLQSALQLLR